MSGPFAEHSIVLESELGSPKRALRFRPDSVPGDRWLHRADVFESDWTRDDVIDRYTLPESSDYEVDIVTSPAGESIRIGSIAGREGRSGGGDLIELCDRERVPDDWIEETQSLDAYLTEL